MQACVASLQMHEIQGSDTSWPLLLKVAVTLSRACLEIGFRRGQGAIASNAALSLHGA